MCVYAPVGFLFFDVGDSLLCSCCMRLMVACFTGASMVGGPDVLMYDEAVCTQ